MKKVTFSILLLMAMGCNNQIYELAYATNRDNDMDICLTNSRNSDVSNLTNSGITEYNLTWTKDGEEIYYTSFEQTGREIKSINVNDRSIKTIINDSTIHGVHDVSRDKASLLITTTDHHKKGELYLFQIGTGEKIRLTRNELYEAGAKFSPDETAVIASIQTRPGDSINHSGIAEIFKINLSNLSTEKLTDLGGFNALPEYSPNGKLIAFHHCDQGVCDIMLMKSDGSSPVNLTKGNDDNRWPRWSPDGKWIAFTKTINDNSDIYFISSDGKNLRSIIATEFRDEIAIFKPD